MFSWLRSEKTGLAGSREDVAWEKVLQLLVVNRLLDPGSEFRVHREWYLTTAMDALLETDFAVAEKNRLYRCLDRVLEHKQELFPWLRQKWADLFQAEFEVLLYDLTSTYFEGAMEARVLPSTYSQFDSHLQRTQELHERFLIIALQFPKTLGHLLGFAEVAQDSVAQRYGLSVVHQLGTQANSPQGCRTHLVLRLRETIE